MYTVVGLGGRTTLPLGLRRMAGIEEGEVVVVRAVADGMLVIETMAAHEARRTRAKEASRGWAVDLMPEYREPWEG